METNAAILKNVTVVVKGARDLQPEERSGTADPFVVAYCPQPSSTWTKIKTRSLRKTLDPVWEQSLTLTCPQDTTEIVFEVFSKHSIGADKSLGAVSVSIVDIVIAPRDEWYKLRPVKHAQKKWSNVQDPPVFCSGDEPCDDVNGFLHLVIMPVEQPQPPEQKEQQSQVEQQQQPQEQQQEQQQSKDQPQEQQQSKDQTQEQQQQSKEQPQEQQQSPDQPQEQQQQSKEQPQEQQQSQEQPQEQQKQQPQKQQKTDEVQPEVANPSTEETTNNEVQPASEESILTPSVSEVTFVEVDDRDPTPNPVSSDLSVTPTTSETSIFVVKSPTPSSCTVTPSASETALADYNPTPNVTNGGTITPSSSETTITDVESFVTSVRVETPVYFESDGSSSSAEGSPLNVCASSRSVGLTVVKADDEDKQSQLSSKRSSSISNVDYSSDGEEGHKSRRFSNGAPQVKVVRQMKLPSAFHRLTDITKTQQFHHRHHQQKQMVLDVDHMDPTVKSSPELPVSPKPVIDPSKLKVLPHQPDDLSSGVTDSSPGRRSAHRSMVIGQGRLAFISDGIAVADLGADDDSSNRTRSNSARPNETGLRKNFVHDPLLAVLPSNRLVSTFFVVTHSWQWSNEMAEYVSGHTCSSVTDVLFQGTVVSRFPGGNNSYIPRGVAWFCCPDGFHISSHPLPPNEYPFVLYSRNGSPMYFHCIVVYEKVSDMEKEMIYSAFNAGIDDPARRVKPEDQALYFPKCYCMCTGSVPCFSFARMWLQCFHSLLTSPGSTEKDVNLAVAHLMRCIPLPSKESEQVLVGLPPSPTSLFRPKGPSPTTKSLPPIVCSANPVGDCPLALLLRSSRARVIVTLFRALLLEQRVVLVSDNKTILTLMLQALTSLLYPLRWARSFIPILPRLPFSFIGSQDSFAIGVTRATADANAEVLSFFMVYDVDNCTINVPTSYIHRMAPLPKEQEATLISDLQNLVHPDLRTIDSLNWSKSSTPVNREDVERGIRTAFLRFFLALLQNYRKYIAYLRTTPAPLVLFDKNKFLDDANEGDRDFYNALFQTQSFAQFIQQYVVPQPNSVFECMLRVWRPHMSLQDCLNALERIQKDQSKEALTVAIDPPSIHDDDANAGEVRDSSLTLRNELIAAAAVPKMPLGRTTLLAASAESIDDGTEDDNIGAFLKKYDDDAVVKEVVRTRVSKPPMFISELSGLFYLQLAQLFYGESMASCGKTDSLTSSLSTESGRKAFLYQMSRIFDEEQFTGALDEKSFNILADMCRFALQGCCKENEFHTASYILEYGKSIYLANPQEQESESSDGECATSEPAKPSKFLIDRFVELDVWQNTAFWEDFFFVHAQACLEELYQPSVASWLTFLQHASDEDKKKACHIEVTLLEALMFMCVDLMIVLHVSSTSVRRFTSSMAEFAFLSAEIAPTLQEYVNQKQLFEHVAADLSIFDDVLTPSGFASRHGHNWVLVSCEHKKSDSSITSPRAKVDEDPSWYKDFWNALDADEKSFKVIMQNMLRQLMATTKQLQNQQDMEEEEEITMPLEHKQGLTLQSSIAKEEPFVHISSGNPRESALELAAKLATVHESTSSLQSKYPVIEKKLDGHTAPVLCLCSIPGFIASGAADNTIRVWNPSDCTCTKVLEHHTGWVSCMCYLPAAHELVSGSYDRLVALWDTEKLVKLRSMRGHKGAVTCLKPFSRGVVLSGSLDNTMQLWDTRSKKSSMVFEGHVKPVTCVSTLGETYVLSGSRDRSVRMWDVRSARPMCENAQHTDWIQSVLLLKQEDGVPLALSCSMDGTIVSWSPIVARPSGQKTGARREMRVIQVKAHQGGVNKLMYHPQHGGSVVSIGADGIVKQYNPTTLTERSVFRGHKSSVTAVASFGSFLVTGGADHTVRIWDSSFRIEQNRSGVVEVVRNDEVACRQTLSGHTAQVVDACQVNETSFATCSWDKTVRLWELSQDFK